MMNMIIRVNNQPSSRLSSSAFSLTVDTLSALRTKLQRKFIIYKSKRNQVVVTQMIKCVMTMASV